MSLVKFDFSKILCSRENRQKFENIFASVQNPAHTQATQDRLRLLDKIATHSYDPDRGVYIPVSNSVFLTRKLPQP